MNGYTSASKRKVNGIGGNLKYFKIDFVLDGQTDVAKKRLSERARGMLCLREGCYNLLSKGDGFELFEGEKGGLGILYDDGDTKGLVEQIQKRKGKFVVYVFTLTGEPSTDEFDSVNNRVELKPFPTGIMNLYRRLFK